MWVCYLRNCYWCVYCRLPWGRFVLSIFFFFPGSWLGTGSLCSNCCQNLRDWLYTGHSDWLRTCGRWQGASWGGPMGLSLTLFPGTLGIYSVFSCDGHGSCTYDGIILGVTPKGDGWIPECPLPLYPDHPAARSVLALSSSHLPILKILFIN